MKNSFILLFGILALLALGPFAYKAGWWQFNYPSGDQFPVQGIDVSHHQGDIDWKSVPKDRVRFVYIKATEGGDWRDRLFRRNWDDAKAAGFAVGAYHFFSLCKSGAEQAKNFLAVVPDDPEALVPAIDIEFTGNCKARPAKEDFLRELAAMSQAIGEARQTIPILYVTRDFYDMYLKDSVLASDAVWIRNIYRRPNPKVFPYATIWQYADNGRVPGIKGPVDLNASLVLK